MSSARRFVRLDSVRADGWFERLGEGNPTFGQLRDIVGERFVAFAFIAGVRITSLTVDRRAPDATLVDFVLGEDPTEQRLALGEFRRRLAAALLGDEPLPEPLPDDPDPDTLQRAIGIRYVLLAPIFGIKLKEMRVGGGEDATVLVEIGAQTEEIFIEELRSLIRDRIRGELSKVRSQSPFAIDLARVPEAETASEKGDDDRVIELLGAWPGPLSLLLRTSEGQTLGQDAKATLGRALGLLGSAYVGRGRFEWAEEVLRLGIQWAQDGPAAGDLFRRLAAACVARDRPGEAIGLFRRALSLGASPHEVLPSLARCYAERSRWVAALVCADEAVALGAPEAELEALRTEGRLKLGAAWIKFRALVPAPGPDDETIPSPSSMAGSGQATS